MGRKKEQPVTSINETVNQSLRQAGYGSYGQYAAPVVSALVDREQQIVGQLIQFATQNGLSEEQARDTLRNIGMEVPTPQPQMTQQSQQQGQGDGDLAATLSRIEQALSGMDRWARTQGYNG
jgi:hypothetical protein